MTLENFNFDDIKIILCSEGYNLDYQYIVREIGFWSNGFSASIPFNVKLNKNHLDEKNRREVLFCEEQLNGIKLKRNFEYGLASSDIKLVLRTLFHMSYNNSGKYIGISSSDHQLEGLLHKSGLGNHIVILERLKSQRVYAAFPDLSLIRDSIQTNPNKYIVCQYHDRLRINQPPSCAKIRAEIIAEWCKMTKEYSQDQERRLQELWSEYTLTEGWNDISSDYKREGILETRDIPTSIS